MSMKFCWELRPTEGDEDFGEELNNQLPRLVRRLLVQRGISGRDEALRFLNPAWLIWRTRSCWGRWRLL